MRFTKPVHLIRFHPDEQLSPHFKGVELGCPCGECMGRGIIALELIDALERLRAIVGKPLRINSGYRCPTYNRRIGGRPDSYHQLGCAVDVSAVGIGVNELARAAREAGFSGVIKYKARNFVHMDLRLQPIEAEL